MKTFLFIVMLSIITTVVSTAKADRLVSSVTGLEAINLIEQSKIVSRRHILIRRNSHIAYHGFDVFIIHGNFIWLCRHGYNEDTRIHEDRNLVEKDVQKVFCIKTSGIHDR